MTDLSLTTVVATDLHTNDQAQRRLKARYRAEFLFQALGLGALMVAAGFLVLFLTTIVRQAIPAFTQNYLKVQVELKREDLNPQNATGAALAQALGAADYDRVVSGFLRGALPGATDRASRRALGNILSSGAPFLLRREVVANPAWLGTTQSVYLPLDDNADLYLKGLSASASSVAGQGELVLSGTSGTVRITAPAGAFGAARALDRSAPSVLVQVGGGVVKLTQVEGSSATGEVLLPVSATRGTDWRITTIAQPEADRRIGDREIVYLDKLKEQGLVERRISREFFFGGASREAELAGVWVAIVGSFLTLVITLAISFPIGVAAAIYLEEFAPKNRFTEIIEVNINNLAAVPSIIYGLLGLAVFLNVFGLPRSAPVVGGLVLALMTLPIIIIASRAAIRAVPPSVKEAALGVGASHQQAVFHHVLPLAMPGMLTGTILGMAHALGETAPLLMIGMVAFVVDMPHGIADAATLLPVQIFMWADFPEAAFQNKTAAAIVVLLVFLILMNAAAVFLRKRFERRW